MSKKVREPLSRDDKKFKIAIVLNVLIAFIALIIIGELIFGAIYKGIYVIGSSMYSTLNGASSEDKYGGDYVYVNAFDKPDYGDIVVVNRSDNFSIIKRVIALGGDRVKIIDGQLYLMRKGEEAFVAVSEDYVYVDAGCENANYPLKDGEVAEEGHLVEDGHMFLLGDHRNVSVDSRDHGDFDLNSLYGVVPDWSIKHKAVISKIHIFFKYSVPAFFGKEVHVEGLD